MSDFARNLDTYGDGYDAEDNFTCSECDASLLGVADATQTEVVAQDTVNIFADMEVDDEFMPVISVPTDVAREGWDIERSIWVLRCPGCGHDNGDTFYTMRHRATGKCLDVQFTLSAVERIERTAATADPLPTDR